MGTSVNSPARSQIELAVLETLAYADIFDYPLTRTEVRRWLKTAATQEEVDAAIEALRGGPVAIEEPYVHLQGREATVATRERRRHSSLALRSQAERYGRWIGRLPFVRMVAVTGALAVDNADAGDDLDYLIVTAKGRVWLTRAMTMAIVRVAALRGVTVCPNYLLAADALELDHHDYYTARELLQMEPVAGEATYHRMLDVNAWWWQLLPNIEVSLGREAGDKRSFLRRGVEALMGTAPFDRLEAWVLARKGAELRRDAGPEAVFDASMCKGHFGGWRERTRALVDERMQTLIEVDQ